MTNPCNRLFVFNLYVCGFNVFSEVKCLAKLENLKGSSGFIMDIVALLMQS